MIVPLAVFVMFVMFSVEITQGRDRFAMRALGAFGGCLCGRPALVALRR